MYKLTYVFIFITLISCNGNQAKKSEEVAGDLNQPGFMWDLAHGKQYTYSYDQQLVNQFPLEDGKMTNKASGTMVINSREDTTGNIKVKDLTATMIAEVGQGNKILSGSQ